MNRLEHLRALLDEALNGDPAAADKFLGRYGDRLLDVAEAANEALENAIPAPRYGECIIEHGALGIALAPLVEGEYEEASHE